MEFRSQVRSQRGLWERGEKKLRVDDTMKRFLFVYSDSCEYDCWPHESYGNALHHEEARFPKGTTDAELVEAARSHERFNERRDPRSAGAATFTRRLVRIIELARDVSFDPTAPADVSGPADGN